MHRPLRERSLEALLWEVLAAREEGLVTLRDRDGLRHGVWVHQGYVVGIRVAGRFDPLLDQLRRSGALDAHGYRACTDAVAQNRQRSGTIAIELGGVARVSVRDALKEQARRRMQALLELATTKGHDAGFEPCPVPAQEMSVRMPLGALLRGAQADDEPRAAPPKPATAATDSGAAARRHLRELARRLHPDLNAHLSPEARQALERDLAAATAAYHGFA